MNALYLLEEILSTFSNFTITEENLSSVFPSINPNFMDAPDLNIIFLSKFGGTSICKYVLSKSVFTY